jgi:transcriptional regulator with GAF, ATPase, and Fis domain
MWQTARDSEGEERTADQPVPGFLLVFHGEQPMLRALRIPDAGLILGRELLGDSKDDDRLSRQHAKVRIERGRFVISDLGSRNGTFVDGTLIEAETEAAPPVVVRTGRTVGVLLPDLRRFEGAEVRIDEDGVVGPTLAAAWAAAERAARSGDCLLLTGESGTGKELAARAFHRAAAAASTGPRGELIAVNCAAIPAGVAERLLFGAKKGAFSGADRDAEGYLSEADGGTLFLDEIGELELAVQAKLLRALDAKEILPVGASRPRPIDVRVVAATLRDLSAEVDAGRFRNDLYFRVGQPQVTLPPLRHRFDDLAYLVKVAVQRVDPKLTVHASLIETCLLRRWPGNVRELLGEVRRAAFDAAEEGLTSVRGSKEMWLQRPTEQQRNRPATAGAHVEPERARAPSVPPPPEDRYARVLAAGSAPLPPHDQIVEALRAEAGNVSRAARALGLHRNQLRRYLVKHPELATSEDKSDDQSDGKATDDE